MDPLDLLGQFAESEQIADLLDGLADTLEVASPEALVAPPLALEPLPSGPRKRSAPAPSRLPLAKPPEAPVAVAPTPAASAPNSMGAPRGIRAVRQAFSRFNWSNAADFVSPADPHLEVLEPELVPSAGSPFPVLGADEGDPFDLGIDALFESGELELDPNAPLVDSRQPLKGALTLRARFAGFAWKNDGSELPSLPSAQAKPEPVEDQRAGQETFAGNFFESFSW